jgi:hypothetical protein
MLVREDVLPKTFHGLGDPHEDLRLISMAASRTLSVGMASCRAKSSPD